jgi:flagellar hook-basal body complex protein FliE
MSLPITGVAPSIAPVAPSAVKSPQAPGSGFTDSLTKLVDSVESSAEDANSAVGSMLDGSGDVHDAMIALQRAELTLQLTVQVRNKLVQAYQDIMRMPV